ncbi:MAG TPA: GUN4 domain-containing protein [Trichormus sp. M33_DOE_039]|nr:GUN4 domain-containing protein [Trichormus sp. M33_DOE_039]
MDKFEFDVFLCHKGEDKETVIEIAHKLQAEYQIKPWLDEWELQPGLPWQPELERQIQNIKSAAVFIGQSGIVPWQEEEIHGFLREFNRRKCPVIPVLLPNAAQKPELPVFLAGRTWVDFRSQSRNYTDPWITLVQGITGKKPGTTPIILPSPPRTPELEKDDLSSEKGIDYTRLRDLLAAKRWKEADKETYLVMIQAVGKKGGDYFTDDELLNFPCTDLRTIDRLWVKYSNGHFGFSIQKEIYLSLGGKTDGKYYNKAWMKFGDRVGWSENNSWLYYYDLTFETSSPRGNLPLGWSRIFIPGYRARVVREWLVVGFGVVLRLFSRIETCKV